MKLSNSIALSSEQAVVATGVSPNSKLTHPRGGLKIGALGGGIEVDEHMRSSDPDICAFGD